MCDLMGIVVKYVDHERERNYVQLERKRLLGIGFMWGRPEGCRVLCAYGYLSGSNKKKIGLISCEPPPLPEKNKLKTLCKLY